MTRASPGKSIRANGPKRLAAVHQQHGQWCTVVVENGRSVRLIEAQILPDAAALRAFLREHRVDHVIRVLPSAQAVCRCVPLPDAAPSELLSAARLLAEAQLPAAIPEHRRAAGVPWHRPRPDGTRDALLTGWRPGEDTVPIGGGIEERWVAEIGALAVLGSGAAEPIARTDQAAGSIALIVPGRDRTVIRALIEDPDGTWERSVDRALAEAFEAAGIPGALADAIPADGLFLADRTIEELARRVGGLPPSHQWLASYGVALGAALAGISPDQLVSSLAQMVPGVEAPRLPMTVRAANWLARTPNAAVVLVLALIVLILLPLGVAWARVQILSAKADQLASASDRADELRLQAALYEQLDQARWPMTKLLADISASAPVGVRVEDIRMSAEQGLAVRGQAATESLINDFERNLNGTGLFEKVTINRIETGSGSASFDISARIVRPYHEGGRADDFAAKTLAQRLYEDGVETEDWYAQERDSRSGRSPQRSSSDERASVSRTSRVAPSQPAEIPAPLSDEQIAQMDFMTATKAWVGRRTLTTTQELDESIKSRLLDEIERLKAHAEEVKGGGS